MGGRGRTWEAQRARRALLLLTGAVVLAGGLGGCGGGGSEKQALGPEQIVAKAKPSVVRLQGETSRGGGVETVGGSGVVIDAKKGLVLTNEHVIAGVTGLTATVLDKTDVPARIVASAPCDDLAVVELTEVPSGVRQMALGNSDALRPGAQVTALGYPESVQNPEEETVVSTTGSVSAVDISTQISPTLPNYPSLIQHQATINPGNSGGPLVNKFGELVGINTLVYSGLRGEVQNQSYAISINHVKPLLPDLEAGKSRADVGWQLAPVLLVPVSFYSDQITQGEATRYLATEGYEKNMFVLNVTPGSPVNKAAIHFGDLIQSINGTPVQTVGDVCDIVQSAAPGSALRVEGHYYYARFGTLASKFGENILWHTKFRVPSD
ncbi:MAG: S1C family serine protease [Solirubrobacterales bacterium]